MTAGAFDVLGDDILGALVITKHGHAAGFLEPSRLVHVVESSHPVPDESCLAAGRALIDFVDSIPGDADVLALASGGASSLVEVLPEGFDASDLARVNEYLLAEGHPIGAMNRVRKRISRIKAGRLARHVAPRRVLNLTVSDVPDDDPKVIGSGLLVPHTSDDIAIDDLELPAVARRDGWAHAAARRRGGDARDSDRGGRPSRRRTRRRHLGASVRLPRHRRVSGAPAGERDRYRRSYRPRGRIGRSIRPGLVERDDRDAAPGSRTRRALPKPRARGGAGDPRARGSSCSRGRNRRHGWTRRGRGRDRRCGHGCTRCRGRARSRAQPACRRCRDISRSQRRSRAYGPHGHQRDGISSSR